MTDIDLNTITTIGVLGAGQMGAGIAQVAAQGGYQVLLADVSQERADAGRNGIGKQLSRLVEKGKLGADARDAALARITAVVGAAGLAPGDFLIEAATENIELKLKLFIELDRAARPGVILASNTSSISITKLAAATQRPDRFIGMHFFNPVSMMALVEIIRGLQTSDATHDAVQALAERLGKSPITVKNAPGFVVNRILVPMINEAFFVLAEGLATPEDIDAGMKLGTNQPIGPLALADMIGLDVCLAVMNVYMAEFNDSKYRPAPLLKEMVAAGWLGRKTSRGVYKY